MGERYQGLEVMEWGRQNKGRKHNIESEGKSPETCLPALSFQQRVSSRAPVGCSRCSQTLRISSPWEKGFSHHLSISFSCLFFIQIVKVSQDSSFSQHRGEALPGSCSLKPSTALLGVALYTHDRVKPRSRTNCQGGFLGGENKGRPLSAPRSPRTVVPTLSPNRTALCLHPPPATRGNSLPAFSSTHPSTSTFKVLSWGR